MTDFDKIELTECALVPADFSLQSGFTALAQLYRELDAALARTTATLDLPCKAGCDACCHQSVFLTPLEFLAAWDWLQSEVSQSELSAIVTKAIRIYRLNEAVINRLDLPAPDGEADHFSLVENLAFRCPLLAEDGRCMVHPARELYARLLEVAGRDALVRSTPVILSRSTWLTRSYRFLSRKTGRRSSTRCR